jgi:HEAT repeat protein
MTAAISRTHRLKPEAGVILVMTADADMPKEELAGLTRLRVRAQEALTESGDYVVSFLMKRIQDKQASPTIIWAAAKTLGELRVAEAAPYLQDYLVSRRQPTVSLQPDGALGGAVPDGDWRELTPEEQDALVDDMEVFRYPASVRWTCAIALGRLGGPDSRAVLRDVEEAEQEFLARLRRNADRREYFQRAQVIEAAVARHEAVLFYIRRALAPLAAGA